MDFVDFSEDNELTEELRDNPLLDAAPALSIEDKAELLGLTQELTDRVLSRLLEDPTAPFSLKEPVIFSWNSGTGANAETFIDDTPLSKVSIFTLSDDFESTCKSLRNQQRCMKDNF